MLSEVDATEAANAGASATAWNAAEMDAIRKLRAISCRGKEVTWVENPPIRGGYVEDRRRPNSIQKLSGAVR